jgi:hypothetical protein
MSEKVFGELRAENADVVPHASVGDALDPWLGAR